VQLKDENHQEDQETRKKSQLKNDAGIDIYAGLKRLAEDREVSEVKNMVNQPNIS